MHFLTVEARDNLGKGNRNIVQIVLFIEDVNDNAPLFLESKYEANLYENKMNFENMLQVRAKDLDLNNEITYEIIDNTEFAQNFSIDPDTGIIMPAYPMDFESIEIDEMQPSGAIRPIHLKVLARDDGVPSLMSNVSVTVYLQDINDNAPQFERDFYAVSILENTDGGSSVLRVCHAEQRSDSVKFCLIFLFVLKGPGIRRRRLCAKQPDSLSNSKRCNR